MVRDAGSIDNLIGLIGFSPESIGEGNMKALRFEFSLPRLAYSKILGTFYKGAYFDRFSALRYADIPEPELQMSFKM